MSGLFELDFLRHALWACLLIGLMLSVMGVYVVLRRIIFVGAALAQASAAGVAAAFLGASLLGASSPALAGFFHDHPETVAVIATLLAAAALAVRPKRVNLPSEGAIGLGYALASTLAILFIAKTPGGEGDTLLLVYGNILAVAPHELIELSVLCPVILLIHALFRKEFLMVSFNPETAQSAGVRVWVWNLLLYLTLGFGIATGIRASGSLLTFSFLVVPALTGLMVARKSWHVTAVAVAVAVTSSIAGIVLSVKWDLPSGPMVVAALLAEATAVWLIARFA